MVVKIRTLDLLPPLDNPALVIVQEERFAVDLSAFVSGSIFVRDIGADKSVSMPVVVVNPTLQTLRPIATRISAGWLVGAELWADSAGFENLTACTKSFGDLAICKADRSHDWLKLYVVSSNATDRPAGDLSFGMSAAQIANKRSGGVAELSFTTTTRGVDPGDVKVRFVGAAARMMKPIKPFLPKRVVHLLYRILGVFR